MLEVKDFEKKAYTNFMERLRLRLGILTHSPASRGLERPIEGVNDALSVAAERPMPYEL
tara:strand:- start:2151 stop:2327 length:177 start_codon:yes stop_codon:yes gene_type:complete